MAMDIDLSFHKKYDVNGYPVDLVGLDIPLPARIFTAADVYLCYSI